MVEQRAGAAVPQPGLQPGQLPQRLNPKLTQRRPMPPPMTASTWMDLMREKEEAGGGA